MAKFSQLRLRAEELRIDNSAWMRKSKLETEIQKKQQVIAAESNPQLPVRQ